MRRTRPSVFLFTVFQYLLNLSSRLSPVKGAQGSRTPGETAQVPTLYHSWLTVCWAGQETIRKVTRGCGLTVPGNVGSRNDIQIMTAAGDKISRGQDKGNGNRMDSRLLLTDGSGPQDLLIPSPCAVDPLTRSPSHAKVGQILRGVRTGHHL